MDAAKVILVRDPLFLDHTTDTDHPENPGRLVAIDSLFLERPEFAALPRIQPQSVGEALLSYTHGREMLRAILAAQGQQGWLDPDTYYGPRSVEVAVSAAGATVAAALEIWRGNARRGFSLVRPPGHHATAKKSMGFCLLNNVALAARAIREESPNARIAIVDFDLHHGNGTQDIFYEDFDVLFISSHRYPYYPGTGALAERGKGAGAGTTVNLPLSHVYDGAFFVGLYSQIVAPLLRAFRADIVLVSAGFDGHVADPMQGFAIQTRDFGILAELLIAEAEQQGGKILFCLEGGYNPQALKESVAVVLDKMRELPAQVFTPSLAPWLANERLEALHSYHVPKT